MSACPGRTRCKFTSLAPPLKLGRRAELRPGTDVTLMATGVCVAEALKAADQLAREGISAAVVNVFTLKPIDRDAVEHYARSLPGSAIVITETTAFQRSGAARWPGCGGDSPLCRWSGRV